MSAAQVERAPLMRATAKVAAAYVSNNAVARGDLPALIASIHGALAHIELNGAGGWGPPREPAVPVKDSVTPAYVVCLEDGKKLKMLKRYLRTHYDLSPEDYRRKWGLPADYPMTAPDYAKTRSQLARDIGLGTAATRPGDGKRRAAAKRRTAPAKKTKRAS